MADEPKTEAAPEATASKKKALPLTAESVATALAPWSEALSVTVTDKVATVIYPSLAAYGARAQSDMTALQALWKVRSSSVAAHAAPLSPKAEHIEAGVLTGPQRLTVVFA